MCIYCFFLNLFFTVLKGVVPNTYNLLSSFNSCYYSPPHTLGCVKVNKAFSHESSLSQLSFHMCTNVTGDFLLSPVWSIWLSTFSSILHVEDICSAGSSSHSHTLPLLSVWNFGAVALNIQSLITFKRFYYFFISLITVEIFCLQTEFTTNM